MMQVPKEKKEVAMIKGFLGVDGFFLARAMLARGGNIVEMWVLFVFLRLLVVLIHTFDIGVKIFFKGKTMIIEREKVRYSTRSTCNKWCYGFLCATFLIFFISIRALSERAKLSRMGNELCFITSC
jgi:hypothetical protein